MKHLSLAIFGSGPAGYTAALYAARAELHPTVFEGMDPGGQLMWTTDVENYPGFPKGILGPDLMREMKIQAERFGAQMIPAAVTEIDLSSRPFRFEAGGEAYEAEAVIVATGASAKWLGVPGEEIYRAHGVSACATCDGFFFKGKKVGVVGGGDAAMEEALFLTKFATEVHVFVRSGALRASKIMAERAQAHTQLIFHWNVEVREMVGDGKSLTGVQLLHTDTEETELFLLEGLFVAVGHAPNVGFLKGQLPVNARGYLELQPGTTATTIPGVFVAGDVADFRYRQAVTAAGSGCMAALDAEKFLAHG